MVKLEEVTDEHFEKKAEGLASDDESDALSMASSDLSDSDEEEEDDDEMALALPRESLLDRVYALKDMVSPQTRKNLVATAQNTASFVRVGGRLVGNVVWVVTTSALLLGLPLALAIDDEGRIVAQEKELQMQQQGAQQMLSPGAIYGQPQQQQQQQGGQKTLTPSGF